MTVNRVRRKPLNREKYLQKTYLIKDCYPTYTKNSLRLNNKKTNKPLPLQNRPLIFIDISPKKIHRWQISIWKYDPCHAIREMEIKQQWGIMTHLLEWPRFRTLATPTLWSTRNFHTFWWNAKCYSHSRRKTNNFLQN